MGWRQTNRPLNFPSQFSFHMTSTNVSAFRPQTTPRLINQVPSPNQSILKEIGLEYSLEGLTLKLKLQYFGHLMQRTNSLEKTLMLERLKAGGEGDDRGWDGWMASLTGWTGVWVNSRSWWRTRRPGVLQSMGLQRVRHDWAPELNSPSEHWLQSVSSRSAC